MPEDNEVMTLRELKGKLGSKNFILHPSSPGTKVTINYPQSCKVLENVTIPEVYYIQTVQTYALPSKENQRAQKQGGRNELGSTLTPTLCSEIPKYNN